MADRRPSAISDGTHTSIHMMLKQVGSPSDTGASLNQSRRVGVTQVEELLMDHQARQSVSSQPSQGVIVGLDDALM